MFKNSGPELDEAAQAKAATITPLVRTIQVLNGLNGVDLTFDQTLQYAQATAMLAIIHELIVLNSHLGLMHGTKEGG